MILSIFILSSHAYAFWVWTPETKRFVNPKAAIKQDAKSQFEYALKFYDEKDYPASIREFKKVITHFPQSSYAMESQYYIGLSLEALSKNYEAYLAYQKLIDVYPASQHIDEVIEREYKIAELFYSGKKQKGLGFGTFLSKDKAIEILKKVVENSPYGKYGAIAQYKLGLIYKEMRNYEEALSNMELVVKNYPDKKIADDARLQLAEISSIYSLGAEYDQSATNKAISEFEKVLKENPDTQQKEEIGSSLESLKDKDAESNFKIAGFYERTRELKSAIIYYEDIVKNFPGTGWAAKAAERIEILQKQNQK